MHRNRIATAALALLFVLLLGATANARSNTGWVQVRGPVLTPTLPWEGVATYEPTVMWDHDRYRLWYTGGWEHCNVGYAESRDGLHWIKRSQPVLRHACHSNVVKTRLGFHVYAASEDGRTLSVSATRDGVHMVSQPRAILRNRPGMWDNGLLANSFAWRTDTGWHLLYESGHRTGNATTNWQIGFARGGPATTWANAQAPQWRFGFDGGIVGGPWLDGGCLYFHASTLRHVLPTDIYRRCGPLNAPGKPELVVRREQSWEVDQVADASVAHAPGRRPLMLFSGVDNSAPRAMIGAAWSR
jgi:hypothetical protein